MIEYSATLTLEDVCQQLQVSESLCIELVDCGIVSPRGRRPADWIFDLHMVSAIQRAMRLQADFDLDWHGVALVCELLEERDRLLTENRLLRQRLSRFLIDPFSD